MPVRTCHAPTLTATLPLFALALSGASALAQTQVVKPPIAQYWMDISTVSMPGMDDVPGMGTLASMMGGKDASNSSFGATRGMAPGRWLDLAVSTQRRPAGAQAIQAIPPGMAMGGALTLLPVQPVATKPSDTREDTYDVPDQPQGRILLYWGCGDAIRAGQPKVLDLSTTSAQDYGKFMAGRGARQRGATASVGNAIWPNAEHRQSVPKGASLVGPHAVTGEGLPASLRFSMAAAQDIMPPLALKAQGNGGDATRLGWSAIESASAYFLHAMGGHGQDMVVWSSSEVPEPGWGLMDYIGNANLDRWLADKVILPASQTQCAIPAGIFAKTDGAMVQGIAYGQDLHLAHPPRPGNPRVTWEPEWTAQIRVKSVALLPLDQGGGAAKMQQDKPMTPAIVPAIPGIPNLGGALKGLFGR